MARHSNRGPGFDTVRLVAACGVMLHHSLGIEMDIVHDDPLYTFSHGYTHLGIMAVAVFFSISGFLVTPGLMKSGNVLEYLSRRFMRIMPLLTVVVLVTALIIGPLLSSLPARDYYAQPATWAYLKNITTSLSLELPGIVNHSGTSAVNAPLWTLRFEWLCYLIVALASVTLVLRHRVLFLVFWLVCIAAFPILHGFTGPEELNSQASTLLYLFAYFGAGVTLALFADRIAQTRLLVGAALIMLTAALGLGLGVLLAPILVTYIAVGLGVTRVPWSDFLNRADLSYGIYLTHSIVLTILINIHEFRSAAALFAACLVLSFGIALATWTFIEKPALAHKSLLANLVRQALERTAPGRIVLRHLEPHRPA